MTSSIRARVAVSAALAAALAAGTATGAHALSTIGRSETVDVKTRAITALVSQAVKGSANTLQPSATSRKAATEPSTQSLEAPTSPAPAAATLTADCASLNLDYTVTNDRVWLHWDSIGAASYTVWRQRYEGSWRSLGSTAGTSFRDDAVNPQGFSTYRVVGGGVTCDLGDWVTMATPDGRGATDAVYGSDTTAGGTELMAQDLYSYAMPSGIGGTYPAFSPDGRRLAVTEDGPSGWSIEVRDLRRPDVGLFSLAMPVDVVPGDAAWSPDGRTIAYTAYTVDPGTSAVTGTDLRTWTPGGVTGTVAGSTSLIQPDWRSSTTLVAAGLEKGTGLFTIPAAGGAQTPVAGTANAGYPAVAPNGTTWFVEGDGTDFYLKTLSPTGTVTAVRHSTTEWFELPRINPSGEVFYVDISMNDPTNPDDNTFQVVQHGTDPNAPEPTAIGAPRDGSLTGFYGYDVRQPKSKGSSDYVGDGNPEILGKDAGGRLWAYYSSDTKPVAGRVSMGAGWNMFNQVVAAGDLDGDDNADVLGRKPDGTLWMYHGLGGGKVRPGVQVGSGWSSYVIVAPGDFNGDGIADLLGRDSGYRLWLYPGKGDGHFGARSLVTSGWGGFSAIIGFGDFNFDGRADILGRERSTGYLYLYPGTGNGAITGRTRLGAGWNTLNAFAAPEFTAGNPGLFGRRPDGTMLYYQVLGDGRFSGNAVYGAGAGWNGFQITG